MSQASENLNRRDLADIEQEKTQDDCSLPGCCGTSSMGRRTFVKLAGLGAAALTAAAPTVPVMAGPFTEEDLIDHCVPTDKKLQPAWVKMLTERGEKAVYQHADLETIGMPIGGIGAGQLYIAGDGRLAHWDIFNLATPGVPPCTVTNI